MMRSAWLKLLQRWLSGSQSSCPRRSRRTRPTQTVPAEIWTMESRVLLSATLPAVAGPQTEASPWQALDAFPANARGIGNPRLTDYTALAMNESAMRLALDAAPDEAAFDFSINTDTVTLINPQGTAERFAIYETQIMSPELAAKFPDIKTYAGKGIDDPTATVQIDLTSQGFHAQVLSADGRWYIDPYFHLSDDYYASYFAADAQPSDAERVHDEESGLAHGRNDFVTHHHDDPPIMASAEATTTTLARTGSQLRTYRLAVAASGEYTAYHGGTISGAQSAIVTAINRVTGIYEKELSIRLQLVANNNNLIYTNASTDPYSNYDASALLNQNQTNIDAVIGSANYDIGHVFTTGGGGLAGLRVVGNPFYKAWGETGLSNPIGDVFYVDYVAHEMGHQFGANHTFNVNDSNRNASTAYEPGSGSTIMSYAGLFGADNLQSNSSAYFHSVSFDEIIAYVDNSIPSVGTRTSTGNSVPTVDAGSDYTIPASTPFTLTAAGNDADGTGSLTYNWEERDLGPAQSLTAADNGSSPLFRSFTATSNSSRTFPRLSNLLAGTTSIGEKLPTTSRNMNFRATVRDNATGGGGVNTDDMVVHVVNTGAAFAVLSPNTNVSWNGGTTQTVTWNVAGTTGNGINVANVRILLSTDGGTTFGTVLAASTENDGSADVAIPNISTSQARIKVEAIGNIFFDISNVNFTISAVANLSPVVNNQSFNLPENVPNGTVVGTVTASDDDAGQSLTYSITGGNTGTAFAINSSTGQITVANSSVLNFETNPTFNLTVQVTDSGAPSQFDTATVTINITDVNEAPSLALGASIAFVDENSSTAGGLVLTSVTVIDDALGSETVSLSGTDAAAFEVVGGNLRVKAGTVLNFEAKDNYAVTVNVNDSTVGSTPDDSQSFVLFLNDVDEPPVISNQSFSVATGFVNGTVVGTVAASDPEGQTLTYAIIGGNTGGAFAINSATGQITVANSAAVTALNSPFSLQVEVTDGTLPTPLSSTATVTINVNSTPTIGGANANLTVNDNTTIAPFATLTITDPDTQNMFARVTILNGVVRGDFTSATTTGWTRTVVGNNILYERFYNPQADIGSVVQAAIRAFVFQPRNNAIKPNTTELTDFSVLVNDGAVVTTNTATRVRTTSVNNAPLIGGANLNVAVNDNATVNPFSTLTVTDDDMQEMLISVTILNGVFRGDFTNATSSGWAVRYVIGNDITYKRYFSPGTNVGASAQAAFRALTFQPRANAIKPGTTEAVDFQVTVSDGVAPAVLGTGNRVTTTSVNNAPTIGGAVANQTMNDNATKLVFSTLTVTDADTQDMLVKITITNGSLRGDFTAASATGWTRVVNGNNIDYSRYFSAAANIGATVQAAIRALNFQSRTNVPIGTSETTQFTLLVKDGLAEATNNATTVIVTGVAPGAPADSSARLDQVLDSLGLTTQDLPTVPAILIPRKGRGLWSRLFERSR